MPLTGSPELADGSIAEATGELGEPVPEAPELLSTLDAAPAAVQGAALRSASFLGGSLFSLGAAALLFRHLGVIDSGRYTTAMSLSAIVTGLTDLGLTGICIRELAVLRGEQRAQLVRNLLGMRIVLASVGVVIVALFALTVYGAFLGLGVLIAGAGVMVQNTQTLLMAPLSARLQLGWVSVLEFSRQLFTAATIALFVVVGAHLLAFLAVTAVVGFITLPPTVALVRGDIPLRPSFDLGQWRALVGPMVTYSVAVITATLYLRVAIVLVSLLDNSRQLGYFSLSYRIVETLFTLPGLLIGSAFPIFAYAAHHDLARLGYVVSRVLDASLIVGVWVSLSLIVGARLAIEVAGGPGFRPAVPVLAVQGLAVAAVFVSNVWAIALLSLHLHRVIMVMNLILILAVAVAVAVLASLYGAQGAAVATAAVEIVAAIAGGIVLIRGRPQLRPSLRVVPKVAMASVFAASPMLLTGTPVIARIMLSSALYVLALWLLRAFPADLRGLLLPGRMRS